MTIRFTQNKDYLTSLYKTLCSCADGTHILILVDQ